MNCMDEEIVMMKRNAIIGLIVSIIILVPIVCLVVSIYNRIDEKKEVFNYILIRDNNCFLCDKVKGVLDSNNISYLIRVIVIIIISWVNMVFLVILSLGELV